MVRSYLTTGLRQIVAQKLYSVINIVGLAVGLASVLLIGLYVRHELSYESMFPNADRIFRISRDYHAREGSPDRVPAQVNAPVAPALLAEVSGDRARRARVRRERSLSARRQGVLRDEFPLGRPRVARDLRARLDRRGSCDGARYAGLAGAH